MVVSCTVIRLHPASGAVVDEAIYLVNPFGGNRREIQCSGVRRREDRTGLRSLRVGVTSLRGQAPRPHQANVDHRAVHGGLALRLRATGAEAADSASPRVRICAAKARMYGRLSDSDPLSSNQRVQRHRRVRTHRISVRSAPLGQQSAGRDVEHRLPVPALLRRDVGWGQVPSHTSRSENDRPVRDLPLI